MTPLQGPSPYVGLQPFREEDYPFFFGRERDTRVISSNFREQPLTIVYGASGVGKSSVLRAGVLPHLRADSGAVAVYYNTWQSDSFLEDLTGRCRTALGLNDPDVRLDKLTASGGPRLFLLLDQFEELLLYHQTGAQAEEFDSLLARIVNRSDLTANVLIGIREDALSRFDQRFSIRIADLLANTLPLEHLNNDAARRAILEPLRVFNERHGLGANGYSMEAELAEEILRQVQPRQFAETEVEGAIAPGPGRVETPFLQLVLQRLWKEEIKADSLVLRLETLRRIGGALQIVDKHVNDVFASLPRDQDREIAAKMFRYLVTPSRSKIAQDTESLVGYGEAPEAQVRPVLSWLSDKPESRILRRLDSPERYEIFHDVLAQPILDWRKKYFAERERIEEVRKRRRLQLFAGAMVLLALVAISFALLAFDQRKKAREAADLARIENQQAMAATSDAQAAHAQADATANALQARQAELAGRTEEAAKLRAAADDAAKQAQNYSKAAEAERNKAAVLQEGKDKNYQDAVQQIANLRSERDQLQSRVASLSTEVEQIANLRSERDQLLSQITNLSTEVEQLRKQLGATPTPTVDSRTPGVVTTYHYDNQRWGWNSQESELDYSNVNSSSLKVQTVRLDDPNDQVNTQPLIARNMEIAGGRHDVVYVATEANNIYAFDANTGTRVKMVNFGRPVQVTCPYTPVVGIDGTPAIDLSSHTMYVITYSTDSSKNPVYLIHALDLATLTDKVQPRQITASQTLSDGKTTFNFNAVWQRQRAGLLVANGNVYAGFASFCKGGGGQSRGWVLGWKTGSLTPLPVSALTNKLVSAPQGMFFSSIWMSGYGIAGDQSGNIYFSTGSSDPSGTTYNVNTNISNSIVRLNPDLTRPSPTSKLIFTPANVADLDKNDLDVGAGGVMLLPPQSGPVSEMAVATAKDGRMFLLNRNNLGGFTSNDAGALDVVNMGNACWCGPTYFNDGSPHIVTSGRTSPSEIKAGSFSQNSSVVLWNLQTSPAPKLIQIASGNMPDTIQNPGFFTTVSSNATKDAIIWVVSRPQVNSQNPVLRLYAFKATPSGDTLPLLFQSAAGSWPNLQGNANVVPVVADGKVYVASYRELDIFGLISKPRKAARK